MKKKITVFLTLFISLFCVFTSKVSAREVVSSSIATWISEGEVGTITLYDDYVVRLTYKYSVYNIEINVCPKENCIESNTQHYKPNQEYFDGDYVDIYLTSHFTFVDGENYTIDILAKFKPYAAAINDFSNGYVCEDVTFIDENSSNQDNGSNDNGYGDEILNSASNVERIIRKYVVPGVYGLLAVMLVVKGILLAMDIAKYSDNPEIRKEKIKGFTYFGVAIILLVALNTFIGFYPNLFG